MIPNNITGYLYRHYRWNFVVNVLDGGCFHVGMSFTSTVAVLPLFIHSLTDSPLAVGLIPAIFQIGWLLPQLFTARHVQGLARNKPFVMRASFHERFQWWLLAPMVLMVHQIGQTAMLGIFYFLFIWWTLGGGFAATAWQNMIATIIPSHKLGGFFGIQSAVGGLIGAGGAVLAGFILEQLPYPANFAMCFFLAGGFLIISYGFLGLTREPSMEQAGSAQMSLAEYGKELRLILCEHANYSRFLIGRAMALLSGMPLGFVALYAITQFGLTAGEIGWLTAILLLSQTVANISWGIWGDRHGHKSVLANATLVGGIGAGVALIADGSVWLYVVFALLGIALAGITIAGLALTPAFAPEGKRPTYIGLTSTLMAIPSGLAPLIGGWIVGRWGYPSLFAVAVGLAAVGYGSLRWAVQEPKGRH